MVIGKGDYDALYEFIHNRSIARKKGEKNVCKPEHYPDIPRTITEEEAKDWNDALITFELLYHHKWYEAVSDNNALLALCDILDDIVRGYVEDAEKAVAKIKEVLFSIKSNKGRRIDVGFAETYLKFIANGRMNGYDRAITDAEVKDEAGWVRKMSALFFRDAKRFYKNGDKERMDNYSAMSRQLDNFADKMDEIRILANRRHEEIKSLRAQVKALKKSLKKKC